MIEKLKQIHFDECLFAKTCWECKRTQCRAKIVLDKTVSICATDNKNGWISVKERLPTYAELKEQEALVLYEDGIITVADFDECMEKNEYFGYWKQNFDSETLGATDTEWIPLTGITHWMKRPQPPKEEA